MDRRPLLDAIFAAPEDDAPRFAYAAALRADGDPRGELIEVQCALAGLPADDANRVPLEKRELSLVRRHHLAWRASLGIEAKQPLTFERGFADHIEGTANWFLGAAPQLTRELPLTRLNLWAFNASMLPAIAAATPGVRALTLNGVRAGTNVGEPGLVAFAASARAPRLRQLALAGHTVTAKAVRAVLASFPELVDLTSDGLGAGLGRDGLDALIDAPELARFEALRLAGEMPMATQLRRLLAPSTTPALTELSLVKCRLGAKGVQRVLNAEGWPGLTRLSLRENKIGEGNGVRIGATLARSLVELELSLNGLNDAWARAFVEGPEARALTTLGLRSNLISFEGVRALLEADTLAAMTSLDVSAPDRTRSDVPRWGARLGELSRLPGFARLRHLDADATGVTAAGIKALAASPHAAGLRSLRLSFNELGDAGARALAGSSGLTNLEMLDLGYTDITADGIDALCASSSFPRLRWLALQLADTGERAVRALCESRAFPRLSVLYTGGVTAAVRARLEDALGVSVDEGDFLGTMLPRPRQRGM